MAKQIEGSIKVNALLKKLSFSISISIEFLFRI